ncbi:MAG: radical SAM family heme chaperone HemW [Ferruginibacter sp.]|nr:radical SAM family heme chaperone HemW [Ferruginibacter sp.]
MSGIYIHIPFCRQACHYCNFHFSTSLQLKDKLVAALVKEIQLTSTQYTIQAGKEICETIYFGGGTPSILAIDDLSLIFDALRTKFFIAGDAEITLEANPDDITPGKLMSWKQAGINRLSVGIQSFLETELVWMNRAHTAADSLRCIDEIKAAGFTDYSIDLIYGSPLLSNENWEHNVSSVITKNIPHISCYALTVEPKTALDKMITQNKKAAVDPEKQAEQFTLLMNWMERAGYEHYEISNFAKPGMRSRHNSSYWQGKNYYGFGPSAHGYDGKKRKWNIANNALYIQSLQKNCIPFEEEILTKTQQLNEYIMTSLRTMEGIDLEKVSEVFGTKYSDQLLMYSDKYTRTNKLKNIHSKLMLTKEGKLFADGIAADLFF